MAKVTAPKGYRVQLNFTRGFAKHSWHVAVTECVGSFRCHLRTRGDRIPGSLLTEATAKAWPEPADTAQAFLPRQPHCYSATPLALGSCTESPGSFFLTRSFSPGESKDLGFSLYSHKNGYTSSLISNNHLKHYLLYTHTCTRSPLQFAFLTYV